MLSRSSFKRPQYVAPPPAPPTPGRRCSNGPALLAAVPKPVEHRNPQLLQLARGNPCLLQIPGVCNGDRETVVACHSNFGRHGKGKSRKADDHHSVWGCARCHTWLDSSYSATYEEREQAYLEAEVRQIACWQDMAADHSAAQWALDRLREEGVEC